MKIYPLKASRGFTLVELILSLCLVGLLLTIFFPLISNSFFGILSTGHRNEVLYQAQQDAEENLLTANTTVKTDTQAISFSAAGIGSLTVKGQLVEINGSSSIYPYSINIFKPYGSLQ